MLRKSKGGPHCQFKTVMWHHDMSAECTAGATVCYNSCSLGLSGLSLVMSPPRISHRYVCVRCKLYSKLPKRFKLSYHLINISAESIPSQAGGIRHSYNVVLTYLLLRQYC